MRTEHEAGETTQRRVHSLSVTSANHDATEDDDNERTSSNPWCRSFSTAFQVSTVNVCCIFAALHLNRLLERSLDVTEETNDEDRLSNPWILPGFVGLYYAGYWLTTVLTFQLRKWPNVVWVFALLGGHVMGLALKQVYVETILLLSQDGSKTTALETALLWSVPLLVVFACAHLVLVYAFQFAVVQVTTVCGRRTVAVADGAAASNRGKAAYAEATNDAYSISLGYILYAGLCGIPFLLVDPERKKALNNGGGLFYRIVLHTDVPCYRPSNQSIETWNRSRDTIDRARLIFVLLFSTVLLFLFPCAAFHLQQRGSRLFEHLHVARQGPAALWYAKHMCAIQMNAMGKALQFCLGWSLYHILSSVIKRERLEHVDSTDSSILLQIFLYTVGFWFCALLLETLKCRPRHQHQRCVNSQRCVKYFTKQVLPAWAVMWATYVALNFDAFFECSESIVEINIYLLRTILFLILAAVIFTVAARFFGHTYSLEFEKELKETMEEAERRGVVVGEGEEQLLHSDS